MRRAPLPMPSFGGTGITGPGEPPLSLKAQLEASNTAARETAADREQLVLENARLRSELDALVERFAQRSARETARADDETRSTDGRVRSLVRALTWGHAAAQVREALAAPRGGA